MRKIKNVLQAIAEDILSNVRMLELADEETAADDLEFYVPRIRSAAEYLNRIAKKQNTNSQGGVD